MSLLNLHNPLRPELFCREQGSNESSIWLKIKQDVAEPPELTLPISVYLRDVYLGHLMKFSRQLDRHILRWELVSPVYR